MRPISIITLTTICFIIGFAFHAYQKEWIIVMLPHQTADLESQARSSDATFTQQKITLYFFKHEQWHKEHNVVIWSSDTANNAKTIINNLLILLEDEGLIDTDIQLLSSVITTNKELFLSFNKDLLNTQDSTHAKLMIIHSLLKTIHENKLPVQSVRFLVHHQILTDDHLNFSIPWSVTGYL